MPKSYVNTFLTTLIDRATGKSVSVSDIADVVNNGGGGGGAVDSVNGQTGAVTIDAASLSLENVDNTSDLDKPISTATQSALGNIVQVPALPSSNGDYTLTITGGVASWTLVIE